MITVDTMFDMNVTDANGTAIDTTILTSGTRGLVTTWDVAEAGFTLQTAVNHMPFALDVRGVGGFLSNTPVRAIHFDSSHQFRVLHYAIPLFTYTTATIGGWISLGAANLGAGAQRYTNVQINTGSAFMSILLKNGTATVPSGYGLCIAYFSAGPEELSSFIEVLPNTWYWVTLSANYLNSIAQLYIYDVDGNQVGSTIVFPFTPIPGTFITGVTLGNNDFGNTPGTTKFECFIVDYTAGQFPLRPFADLTQPEPTDRAFPFRPGVTLTRRA